MRVKLTDYWKKHHGEFDAIIFDIDGTLTRGMRSLPGAVDFITALDRQHFPYFLLTNDGNHSTEEKSGFLRRADFTIDPAQIVSCGSALAGLVRDRQYTGKRFFVVGELGNPSFADRAGLVAVNDPDQIESCAGVVMGEGIYDWRTAWEAVIGYFRRHPAAPFIVPNPDTYWPSGKHGEIGIGAGGQARSMLAILAEMGVHLEPVYLGKPYRAIYDCTVELLERNYHLKCGDYRRILMVGDSLASDIRGANLAGMTSAVVLTGITDRAKAEAAQAEFEPDHIFDTIG